MGRGTTGSPLEAHALGPPGDVVVPPQLERSAGHLMWRAAARVDLALARLLPDTVDIHAWAVLVVLGDGVPRSQQALADELSVSRTTLARVAEELAAAGFVERQRNPDDRRSYLLTRTEAGAEAATTWRLHAERVEDALTAGFTTRDRRDLHRLLLVLASDVLPSGIPRVLDASTGFLVTRLHLRLHRQFSDELSPWGIMPRDFGALTLLQAGPVAQGELGRLLGTSAATVVQIVDDLEQASLVERRRDPHDRRSQLLHVLPRGEEVWRAVKGRAPGDPDTGFGPLDPAQTDRLNSLLARFIFAPLPEADANEDPG